MATFQAPAAHRRRLLRELRRYRTDAKRTQKDVAQALEWSPSKVIRIESGAVQISMTDLRALLALYGVADDAVVQDLVASARESRKQSWTGYRDVVTQEAADYFGLEASASIIRQHEPLLIPGLLQTPDYTRALLADGRGLPAATVERHVDARGVRQELLNRDDPPGMFFIIGEAAVRQAVGGAAVMRDQLDRLEELGKEPGISIQIMPFAVGAHPGLSGPFVLLEFSGSDDDTVLYLENQTESVNTEDAELIGGYLERFLDLERRATDPHQLTAALAGARRDFAEGGGGASTTQP